MQYGLAYATIAGTRAAGSTRPAKQSPEATSLPKTLQNGLFPQPGGENISIPRRRFKGFPRPDCNDARLQNAFRGSEPPQARSRPPPAAEWPRIGSPDASIGDLSE